MIAVAVFVFLSLAPLPAHAYLVPLIGAAGAIITMLIGFGAVALAALYLLFYKIRRWQKNRKK